MYGEINSLTNKMGYCFATNKYFASLYNVNTHTVSRWISHLEKIGYIYIELIRDKRKEIRERRIYIRDNHYVSKSTYSYVYKSTYPMYENIQDNTNNINKDDLFILIKEKSANISNELYTVLNQLELVYPEEIISIMQSNKVEMLKDIIYVLYNLYNSNFKIYS